MQDEPTFRIARSLDDLMKVFMVRAIVFMEEQHIRCRKEIDEHEHSALHVLGEIESEPVAAGRIRFLGDSAKLERLAVRQEYRTRGYGSKLLVFMLATARDAGFTRFKLHAQVAARRFYARQGFEVRGEPFLEVNIEHCLMVKEE